VSIYFNNYLFLIFLFSCSQSNDTIKLLNKAVNEIQNKKYDLAYEDLNKLIDKDTTSAEAYWLRGQVLDLQGKDKSIVCVDLKKSADLGFEKAKLAYSQYCIEKPKEKYKELLVGFESYISKYPDKFEGYYDRANLNFDYGFLEKAIEDYSKVISINKYSVAFYNRGLSYLKLGQKEKGCLDINEAIKLGYEKAKEALQVCK
jgi:tetratricopeptide (TPR) repeat protein